MSTDANSQDSESLADPTAHAQQRAARKWRALRNQLRTVTPSALARGVLVFSALFTLLWVVRASWPAPLPFLVGGVIAYLVLPVVNRLERVMPRFMAALFAVALVLTVLFGTVALVTRAVVLEVVNAYDSFPETTDIRSFIDNMDPYISQLPDSVEPTVRSQLEESLIRARQRASDRIASFDRPIQSAVLGIVNAIAVVTGLLILPIWLLLILRDQRSARLAIDRVLPDWMEGDFWGIVRLFDRAIGTFLRGIVLTGLAVGASLAAGLIAIDRLGFEGIRYPIALGLLAVVLELIPVIGPIVLAITVLAIPATESLETSAAVLVLLILIRVFVRNRMASRIERKVIDVPPAILIVVLVMLSEFGLLWTLLAAPVAAVGLDLFRYTYGRFSDPPRPAGVLPGESLTAGATRARRPTVAAAVSPVRRVPLVYMRRRPNVRDLTTAHVT